MKLWPVAPFFSLTFGWVFFLKREEDSLACSLFEKKTQPKVSKKKGATGQSFIRKEITTYRIAALEPTYLSKNESQ